MRLLLTSGGVRNPSIHRALLDLLGKPIEESTALVIPTAGYAHHGGIGRAWEFVSGGPQECPMAELGWKSIGLLELSVLPSLDDDVWVPLVRETDVLLVNGGDPMFLTYWMRQSGLAALLPTLTDTLWVGLSAGSMVCTRRVGEDFVEWRPPMGGDDTTLGYVDFSIFPHVDHPDLPDNHMGAAEKWAEGIGGPAYIIDDDTAIVVNGDRVEVVSEGTWKLVNQSA